MLATAAPVVLDEPAAVFATGAVAARDVDRPPGDVADPPAAVAVVVDPPLADGAVDPPLPLVGGALTAAGRAPS